MTLGALMLASYHVRSFIIVIHKEDGYHTREYTSMSAIPFIFRDRIVTMFRATDYDTLKNMDIKGEH